MEKGEAVIRADNVTLYSNPSNALTMWKSILMGSMLVVLCVVSARRINGESDPSYPPRVQEDTSRINQYIEKMNALTASDPARAIELGRQAFALSENSDFSQGLIKASRGLAKAFVNMGSLDSALYYHRHALREAEARNDSLEIGISLLKVGSIYRRMSDFSQAVDYSNQAKNIIERYGNQSDLADLYDALQLVYFSLPNYEQAIGYGEKAVALAREVNNRDLLVQALSNLSMNLIETQQYDAAKKALVEAQVLADQTHDLNAESAILVNLGGVSLKQEDYKALHQYADRALVVALVKVKR